MMRRFGSLSVGAVCVASAVLALLGCSPQAPPTVRTMAVRGNSGDIYLQSVAATLNNLPDALNLELLPAQPILTATTSADGNEVRAICIRNPANPEGPINYLHAVDGNARFQTLGVKPGDIVRYYATFDQEAAEQNFEQRTALELRVRRLDAADPENVIILDGGGLNMPMLEPQRIEVWRYSDKRMDAIRSMLAVYQQRRIPASGWEPSPDLAALQQIVERGNQWLRSLPPAEDDWKPTPLLAQLPVALRDADGVRPAIARENLADGVFADWEGRLLEQAVWSRDIAQWVRSQAASDLDAAVTMFDWVVRNIQLDPPASESNASVMIHHPWQAMAYGHGTAEHRAWTFIELCRQQGIDAAVLEPKAGAGAAAPLLVAALIEDELYVFDPAMGLPLPGKQHAVGTLAELAADDALLRQFDVGDDLKYPLAAEQLADVTAAIAATPLQLARRSARLEAALKGEDFVKLAVNADELAARLAMLPHVAAVRLWERPLQAIADEFTLPMTESKPYRPMAVAEFQPFADRPLLWKARVLHFQGNKGKRAAERSDPLAQERAGHQDALALYQDPTVRPSDATLAKLAPAKQAVYGATKSAASYWLGLLSYDRGNLDVAATWLGARSLEREPAGRWANSARYNLARTFERQDRVEEAIKLLEATPEDAPQRHGNLVRARRLAKQAADDESSDEEPAAESGAE